MQFRVIWLPQALQELRQIGRAAQYWSSVIRAARRITRDLAHDPDTKGRVSDGYRIYTQNPVCALYYVAPSVKVVWIMSVNARWGSAPHAGNPGTP